MNFSRFVVALGMALALPIELSAQATAPKGKSQPVRGVDEVIGSPANLETTAFYDGVRRLGNDIREQLKQTPQADGMLPRVAVFPLRDQASETTVLGKHVAERLTTSLFDPKSIRIIERTRLDEVLREQKLAETGALDAKTAQKVGNLAGANVVITGSLVDLGEELAVDLRAIDCKSGEVVGTAEANLRWSESLRKLAGITVTQASATTSDKAGTAGVQKRPKRYFVGGEEWEFEVKSAVFKDGQVTVELQVTSKGDDTQVLWLESAAGKNVALVSDSGTTWSATSATFLDQATWNPAFNFNGSRGLKSVQKKKNVYLPGAKETHTLVFETDEDEVPTSVTLRAQLSGWDVKWAADNALQHPNVSRSIRFAISEVPVTREPQRK